MSNDNFQRVEEPEKSIFSKKLAAGLAVAGACGAATLLITGQNSASPAASEMLQTSSFLSA
jgi:hypothetical protein